MDATNATSRNYFMLPLVKLDSGQPTGALYKRGSGAGMKWLAINQIY